MEFHPPLRASPPFTPFHPFVNRVGVKVCACIKSSMLGNEKYAGDALLQKTYTVDFLSKKRVKNNGIVPQYFVENSHDAIIPREVYNMVQEEMARRDRIRTGPNGKRRTNISKNCFSQTVYCGECGEIFRKTYWYRNGKRITVYCCLSRLEKSRPKCGAKTVKEEILKSVAMEAINRELCQGDDFLDKVDENVGTVIREDTITTVPQEEIDKRLEDLQRDLLKKAKLNEDYDSIAAEVLKLREIRDQGIMDRGAQARQIEILKRYMRTQQRVITEFDESLVRQMIGRITVYGDRFKVEFKWGSRVVVEG